MFSPATAGEFFYTVDGDTSRNEEITDRCGNKTAYEYDEAGRTTKVTSKNANGNTIAHVSYAYDAFNNMTEIVRGDGMKYALAYNDFHNLESIGVNGKSEKLIKYTYKNGNGRLKEMTYANGHKMKATYNSIGQMVAEKWYNSSNALVAHYKYVYDGQGNIIRSIDILAKKEYNYIYDEGRLVRATENTITLNGEMVTGRTVVNTVRYKYNSDGQMTSKVITPASGSAFTYYYTHSNDNTSVQFTAGGRTVTSHSKTDSFGRKVFDEIQLGTDFVTRQFTYHAGQVTEEHQDNAKLKSAATTQLVSQIVLSDGRTLSYEYDEEERITKVTDSFEGTTEYIYDALGQLLAETVDGVLVNSMVYDNYGNILSKNGVAYEYCDDAWKDKLTAVGDDAIEYDAQGNPTSYLGHTLTWEKGRQLKSFDSNTYTYNANGIRTSKTVNGVKHTYTFDGTKILRETWGSNTLIPLYDNEDTVCGIVYNSTPYYFLKNLQGDIIAIVNKEGDTVARYSYDAWGKCTVISDTSGCSIATINPYCYRGYYYDTETSLYYLQSRYYDANTDRCICADVDEAVVSSQRILDCNHFSYCENDPMNNTDENGGISFKKVMSIFNSIAKYAKKIMSWIKDYVDSQLALYTGFSPYDISAIAKDIKRSPHRVRQALQSLNKKWSNIKTRIGKMARAVTIVGLIVSVAYSLASGVAILDIVAGYIVEGLVELTKWLVSEGLKKLISLIPAVGALLGFALGKLISIALDVILSTQFVKSIRDKFQKKVNVKTYQAWDYFVAYFKCWA